MDIDPQYPRVSNRTRRDLAKVRRELESQAPEGASPDPYAESATEGKKSKSKKRKKGKQAP